MFYMRNRWNITVLAVGMLSLISCVQDAPEVEHTLGHAGALCGEEELPTMDAYAAVRNGDDAGVAGLVSRGKVAFLKPGTVVRASSERDGLTYVRVMSGASLGKYCYIPTRVLAIP
jgi:hypothetical protein